VDTDGCFDNDMPLEYACERGAIDPGAAASVPSAVQNPCEFHIMVAEVLFGYDLASAIPKTHRTNQTKFGSEVECRRALSKMFSIGREYGGTGSSEGET